MIRTVAFIVTLFSSLWGINQAKYLRQAPNDSPIIGIFSQPSTSSVEPCNGDCLYIAASYVKFIEAAGGRVIPINYYASKEELTDIFSKINGVVFTGGSSEFTQAAQDMFDIVVAANDQGDYSPLWGTCMGFEWLLIAATQNVSILDGVFDAHNYSIPLEFVPNAGKSRLFGDASPEIMKILATEDVTMNNHYYGIFTEHFKSDPKISSFFQLLSTNKDRVGVEFVSTMEAYSYPIYGVQWHPEKNAFEWEKENGAYYEAINHSAHGIAIEQYLANFFVAEARKNYHVFANVDEEESLLIYNWPKSRSGPSFVESYFFPNDF